MAETTNNNISATRKILKTNLLLNNSFNGQPEKRELVLNLINQTIVCGESNSALLIGPSGSGKTTLVNDILDELADHFRSDAVLVRLHGLVHTDDRLALRSITGQMQLDNAVDGKVFGSFADNLSFLLACLGAGRKDSSKSVIFVLDAFDLFCLHHNQTLLYNLFDTAQSAKTPICVLGLTSRLDVANQLEKRVSSRYSHRSILLFLGKGETDTLDNLQFRLERIKQFLILSKQSKLDAKFIKEWNTHIEKLIAARSFQTLMQRLLDLNLSERILKNILFVIISQLDDVNSRLTVEAFAKQIELFEQDDVIQALQDLNVLELCLVIAMKHHVEIYDNQPMNFEMVYSRFVKFVNSNSNMQSVQRTVIMKAFEHLEHLGLISMMSSTNSDLQKEYRLFKFLVLPFQLQEAVKKSTGLPTEVAQWASSSFV